MVEGESTMGWQYKRCVGIERKGNMSRGGLSSVRSAVAQGQMRRDRELGQRRALVVWIVAVIVLTAATPMVPATYGDEQMQDTPDWLEPRGLNVVEMVGQVPEEYLHGTIISYNDWQGIVVYESGTRIGNQVEITTTMYPRLNHVPWAENELLTNFGCLGQAPHYDHMGSVVPPSTLRVYDSTGREVTSEILLLDVTNVGLQQPYADADAAFRYPQVHYGPDSPNPLPLDEEGLHLPANAGCWIRIPGADYYPLTGVFTLELSPSVYVSTLGSQTAGFQSYIGEGWLGLFQPLMNQLRDRYGDRHGRVPLQIPPDANYFLLKFPPMPGDPYTDTTSSPSPLNVARPTGGTYRLSDAAFELSTNMIFSAGFPLLRAWLDADDAQGSSFLPVMQDPPQLATPEYVVPTGITYNDCFINGSCPDDVLQQIHDAEMTLEIIYLHVYPPSTGTWSPVKMAGPAWQPTVHNVQSDDHRAQKIGPAAATEDYLVFLPLLAWPTTGPPPPPPGCPCGWFDPLGRMLGLAP